MEASYYGEVYSSNPDILDIYEPKIAIILGLKFNCLNWFINRSPNDIDSIFETVNDIEWDDHEEDMKDISRIFPDITIKLSCVFEENDKWSEWTKFFKNGEIIHID